MSISPVAPRQAAPPRRVRHQAREAVAVMAFSAATSAAVALALLAASLLGTRG